MRKKENEQPEEAVKEMQEPIAAVNNPDASGIVYTVIGELAKEAGTPEDIYEGVKVAMGWKEGKTVSREEYDAAVSRFLHAPADGRREDKN